MPALLALLLLIGGGVSAAAEQSVPGDFLYPVKINFNEEVRSILAVTDQDEARWQTQAAERRLSEAETLTERGTLDEATRATLEDEFTANVASAEEHTTNLVAAGELASASDIILNLESALTAHQQIITQLTTTANTALAADVADGTTASDTAVTSETRSSLQVAIDELGKLSQKVSDKLEEVAVSREAVDVQLLAAADKEDEAETLARNREKSAEDRLLSVRAHLETRRAGKGPGSGIDAEASLLAADNALDRGRAAIGDKDFTNAYRRYQEAIKQALEADSFLRAEEDKDSAAPAQASSPTAPTPDAALLPAPTPSPAPVGDLVPDPSQVLVPTTDVPPPAGAPAPLNISPSVPPPLSQ